MQTSDQNQSRWPGEETTLVQMLPKGLVTIPQGLRQTLGLDAKRRPYLRVKLERGGIRLEPVQVVGESQLRDYSAAEVERFIAQDQLDSETQNWAKETVEKYEPKG